MNVSVGALAEPPRLPTQRGVAVLGLLALAASALVLGADSWKHGVLLLIGGLLGMSLYHAAFGFTSFKQSQATASLRSEALPRVRPVLSLWRGLS